MAATAEDEASEGLLSFWGEPFMSSVAGRQVPRYVFQFFRHTFSRIDKRAKNFERFVHGRCHLET